MAEAVLSMIWRDTLTSCRVLGEATHLWPDAAAMMGRQLRRPTTRAQRRAQAQTAQTRPRARHAMQKVADGPRKATHQWVTVGSSPRCSRCMCWDRAGLEACSGDLGPWLELKAIAHEHGHQLYEGILYEADEQERAALAHRQGTLGGDGRIPAHAEPPGLPMVMCRTCGAFATAGGRPQHLCAPCRTPTHAGKTALDRVFVRGLNPKSGRRPRFCAKLSRLLCVDRPDFS